jgi:hypothetical protein
VPTMMFFMALAFILLPAAILAARNPDHATRSSALQ